MTKMVHKAGFKIISDYLRRRLQASVLVATRVKSVVVVVVVPYLQGLIELTIAKVRLNTV